MKPRQGSPPSDFDLEDKGLPPSEVASHSKSDRLVANSNLALVLNIW